MPDPVLNLRPGETVSVEAPTGEVVLVTNRAPSRVTLAIAAPPGWPIRRMPRQGGDEDDDGEL